MQSRSLSGKPPARVGWIRAASTCTALEDPFKKIVPMELIEFIKNLADKDSIEADAVKMRLFPCT